MAPRSNPMWTIVVIYSLMMLNSMTITIVYSFLPKMVKSFGASEVDAGYHAGLIASAIFATRTVFNIYWGNLSDKIGRKVPLAVAAYLLALSTLVFGFSTSFYWALFARFVQGVFMVLNVLCKSIVVDICDDKTFTFGFSILISSTALGRILGPCIGGFLAFPAEQYPNVFTKGGTFGKFPILLPNLILSCSLVLFNTIMIVYLPNDYIVQRQNSTYDLIPSQSDEQTNSHSIETDSDTEETESRVLYNKNSYQKVNIEFSQSKTSIWSRVKTSKLYAALRTKECLLSCIAYAIYSFSSAGSSETFPLFTATTKHLRGLGFTTSEIGTALLIGSIFLAIFQFTIQPKLGQYLRPKRQLIYAMLGLVFLLPLLPSMVAIKSKTMIWIAMCSWVFLTLALLGLSNLAINLFIKNSVTPDLLGSAMGLGQASNCVGSMLSPTIFGGFYTWSLKNVDTGDGQVLGFPYNQYFVFLLQSLWAVFMSVFTSLLPDSMEKRKIAT